jgi:hypothetical protein
VTAEVFVILKMENGAEGSYFLLSVPFVLFSFLLYILEDMSW